jgi:hypothetical protein
MNAKLDALSTVYSNISPEKKTALNVMLWERLIIRMIDQSFSS